MKPLALVALLIGCGGSAGPGYAGGGGSGGTGPTQDEILLVGNWISTVNSSCDEAFDVTATEFVFAVLCVNADLSVDAQAQKGTWSLSGSTLTLANAQASCPAATAKTDVEAITVSASSLSFSDSAGIIDFARNTAAAGSGALTYGCFNAGVFTPSPLAPF